MNELRITRTLDAPRDAVFSAWLDPDQVAEWWGPEGFETPRDRVEIEPRVGGRYNLIMVAPGGAEYPVRQEIVELAEPELLVLRHEAMPDFGMPEPTVTRIELRDEGGNTHMTLTSGPYTDAMLANAERGWDTSMDTLEALLGR